LPLLAVVNERTSTITAKQTTVAPALNLCFQESKFEEFSTREDRGVKKKLKLFVLIGYKKAHTIRTPADASIYSLFVG
jgi:hypothetical protein